MTLAVFDGTPVGSTRDHATWPDFSDAELIYAGREAGRGPFGANGPVIREAEEAFAQHFGVAHAVLGPNATLMLEAAQRVLGVGVGDEVVQTPYTFPATAHSTQGAGGVPVFGDIRADTLSLDPDTIEITDRTRAIMPVSMHGVIPPDLDAYRMIAVKHNLPIIYDNAQAAGATFGEANAGNIGDVAVISLNHKKILCADQGAILLTGNKAIADAVRQYIQYGMERLTSAVEIPSYWMPTTGTNLAATNHQAALASARLYGLKEDGRNRRGLQDHVKAAQRNMETLNQIISGLPGLVLPDLPEGSSPAWQRPRFTLDPEALGWERSPRELRDRIGAALRAEGLPIRSWQEWPAQGNAAFRRQVPYVQSSRRPATRPAPYDPVSSPVTVQVLESGLIMADHPWAWWAQPERIITDHYGRAFHKVWEHMEDVMNRDFETPRPRPWPNLTGLPHYARAGA
ncbi:DegT/DnrJ/EryC1/StrS family aminotransferase [Conexibacter stalactiti]|uniref:DegT/DnrJ/EryC1/StrS family aminotransferase n=1 Tax=Conexibacter stalactiti TaxID=1940611 RepID=A0ABU4HVS7_9ACTN|nr:DegT/DnrJ/EryC1/StrS family aminotransferase [Conexibacter stalactiti]MDW5597430.1 DegT/DnrJ/EryC1/StrS family aminotransferase [Conexibacter stalactiti]MEC5038072.1 DegT/DnrJ/EryC1/StrS family aminotransferase [Conexibacter stalactiti]